LARSFRLWEKKRGDRRTGSRWKGAVGEALFFVSLLLIGVTTLIALATSAITETKSPLPWLAGEEIAQTLQPTESQPNSQEEQPAITSSLNWGYWLTVLVLVSFVFIGGGGVLYALFQASTSVERRAAIAKRAADIDLLEETLPSPKNFPSIPRGINQTNSPGTHLAYRLPLAQTPGWRLTAAAIFCLLWNAMAAGFAVLAIQSHLRGNADWLLTVITFPVVVIGGWSIYYFIKELLMTTWIGPINIEISDHPLRVGRQYDVFLTQSGQLTTRSLRLLLVCEEETTFHQGTDIRYDTRRVYESEIFERLQFDVAPGRPLEKQCQLTIPAQAMHSFQSPHNTIQWKLVVSSEVVGWPKYERPFPIVVYPESVQEAPA